MKKLSMFLCSMTFLFAITGTAQAELILFEDFEDSSGFTTGGASAGYWGIAPLTGIASIPSNFTQGGSQVGSIFYGSFGKDSFDGSYDPTLQSLMTISLPDLTGYTNLQLMVTLAAPEGIWEPSHRDSLHIINGTEGGVCGAGCSPVTGVIDSFLPSSYPDSLRSTVHSIGLGLQFQDFVYTIDNSMGSLTFGFASTDYPEVIGIDSVRITGDPDTDHDGTPDSDDDCSSDPNKTAPGICGCGVADTDTDGDGVADCNDECPNDADTFLDDFNDGNADGWIFASFDRRAGDPAASWSVQNGKLVDVVVWDGQLALVGGLPLSSQVIETEVYITAWAGITLWYKDIDNFVVIGKYPSGPGSGIYVGEVVNGIQKNTTYGYVGGTQSILFDFRAEANSTTGEIKFYVDGEYNFTHTVETTIRTGLSGVVGGNGGGHFDYFRVTSLGTDSDSDGTADCEDDCSSDPNKTTPGVCGCGVLDTDTDADDAPDCIDQCSNDAAKTSPGVCGCNQSDIDTDHDGLADCNDRCSTQNATGLDADSDGCVDSVPGLIRLIIEIPASKITTDQRTGLLPKAQSAQNYLVRGKISGAVALLRSLINQVNSNPVAGKKISADVVQLLNEYVQNIITSLNAG